MEGTISMNWLIGTMSAIIGFLAGLLIWMLYRQLTQHDKRIGKLETAMAVLSSTMGDVKDSLDKIENAVVTYHGIKK